MSLDSGHRTPTRSGAGQDLWPKWMWVAVPVLVVFIVGGLWWAIFAPSDKAPKPPTPSPTLKAIKPQPTQGLPLQGTAVPSLELTPTRQILPVLPTFTPTPLSMVTPTGQPTVAGGVSSMSIGSKVKVVGTGGSGLNMRAGAGTAQPRVKTLHDGATVEIIGGPKEANGFTWYQIKDEAGASGWVVSRYLQ